MDPTQGPTIQQIRQALNDLPPEPRWYFARELEYLDAAQDFGVDPDRWNELSVDAQALILARYRARGIMRQWEDFKLQPKN